MFLGTLYDESLSFVMMSLVGLHTAGWDDVNLVGPQMKLINSTFWSEYLNSVLHTILPTQTIGAGMAYAVCLNISGLDSRKNRI